MQIDSTANVSTIMRGKVTHGGRHKLVTAQRTHTVADAMKLFAQFDLHHLPVVRADSNHELLGIVSATDLLRHFAEGGGNDVELKDIMTEAPKTVYAETEIREAVRILANSPFQCLPVVEPGARLVGIVTTRDIVRLVDGQYDADILTAVVDKIEHPDRR